MKPSRARQLLTLILAIGSIAVLSACAATAETSTPSPDTEDECRFLPRAEATVTLVGISDPITRIEFCTAEGECPGGPGGTAADQQGHAWRPSFPERPLPTDVLVRAIGIDQTVHSEGMTTIDWVEQPGGGKCGGVMEGSASVEMTPVAQQPAPR